MVGLGVSEKQKDRARQVFEKSADLSGFFESGKTKLVMPALAQGAAPNPEPAKDKVGDGGQNERGHGHGHGSGKGSGGGSDDQLIQALLQKLPKSGPWSADERMNWLKLLVMAFQISYGNEPEIEVKKKDVDR
jgi:hypothetical protein